MDRSDRRPPGAAAWNDPATWRSGNSHRARARSPHGPEAMCVWPGSCRGTRLARLRLGPTRHARRFPLARASRRRHPCRSLGPVGGKPASETWLECEDRRRSRRLGRSSLSFSRSVQPKGLICKNMCRLDDRRVFPCKSDVHACICLTNRVQLLPCTSRPSPTGTRPPRHPPARRLARERQGQKTHPRQSLQVAQGQSRHPAPTPQRRAAGRARRRLRHRALPPPRPCRGGAGDAAQPAPGPTHRPHALARARPCAGNGRRAHPRPRLEARHRPRAGRGHRAQHPRPDVGLGAARRGRPVCGHGLAPRAPGPHRTPPGEAPSRGRDPGALRPDLGVDGRAHLPAGQARSFA